MLEGSLRSLMSETQVKVSFYGPSELLALARRQESVTKELRIADGPLSSDSDRGQGYVCLVDLKDLYLMICEPGTTRLHSAIFEANVRDRYPSSSVNRAIYKTLEDTTSPDFWWLNNGVTILSPKARQYGKKLLLDNPQIVNGLQTSNEIFEYFQSGGSSEGRLVLVRVICATDETVSDEIIRATNNQNILPGGALRATDRLQHDIEEYLSRRGFYYDRRKHFHLNRKKPSGKIISMEFLAQSLTTCLLREPWRARGDVALLLEDEHYPRIFNDDIPDETYLSCLLITRRVKRALESSTVFAHSGRFMDDYLFHVSTAATILLTRRAAPSATDIANLQVQRLNDDSLMDLVPIVADVFSRFLGRTQLRPESSASEDKSTSEVLIARVGRMLSDPRSTGWPEHGLSYDYRNFGKDVVYRSESRSKRR